MTLSRVEAQRLAAAAALSLRGAGRTAPNPNVGCVLWQGDRVVGAGWTQPGGRPHAEAMALAMAGDSARGARAYVTLEPCVHASARGPACADSLIAAGVARVVVGLVDPDARMRGAGIDRLRAAGIAVDVADPAAAAPAIAALAPFLMRQRHGRAHVTLKLATSLDGRIALASGESRWITGAAARAYAHVLRSTVDAILVGRGTYAADAPALDVRLPGLEDRAPQRLLLSSSAGAPDGWAPDGWAVVRSPIDAVRLPGVNALLVEGGASVAAAFLSAGLVDRLALYRAPILIGGTGLAAIGDIGLGSLDAAHGRWRLADVRALGSDRLELYDAARVD